MAHTGKLFHKRYRLQDKLSSGEMSEIYSAIDQENGELVAVKLLHDRNTSRRAEDVVRFHSLLNILSRLDIHHITKILDFGITNDSTKQHFVVMELLPGKSLQDCLEAGRTFSIEEVIFISIQVCQALDVVHQNQVIHGDLKPANIAVIEDSKQVSIKLIDFGLSRIRNYGEEYAENYIAGTFQYMSPEQCGITRYSVDERSDLYSLGIIIYFLLTGVSPFEASNLIELLHLQAARIPNPPSTYNPEISAELDNITRKLLEKEPERRYSTASGLAHDLDLVLKGNHGFTLGSRDRAPRLDFNIELVGRDKEFDRLKNALSDLNKKSGLYLITGEAGIGKSRLVEEVRKEVLKKEIPIIEGKAIDRRTKNPFEPIRDAITDYLRRLRLYPENIRVSIIEAVKKDCHDLGQIIIRFNEETRELLGDCPELTPLYPEQETRRFYLALSRMLNAIVSQEKGLVLVLEDLHWADEGTLHLIDHFLVHLSDIPLMILGAYRDDEIIPGSLLDELSRKNKSITKIPLRPFSQEETTQFINRCVSFGEKELTLLTDSLWQWSRGNPIFIIEILRQLVDKHVIRLDRGKFRLDTEKLAETTIPATVVDVILNGIEKLSAQERRILTHAAILGKSFLFDFLCGIEHPAGKNEKEVIQQVLSAVEKAAKNRLIIEDPTEHDRYTFTHDRIRDAFYQNIPERERKMFHSRIGLFLEGRYKGKTGAILFDLAGHFIEAGDDEKIIRYAYLAAEKARKNYAYNDGLIYYQKTLIAIENLDGSRKGSPYYDCWLNCLEGLGALNAYKGNTEVAIDSLTRLLPYISDSYKKANLYMLMSRALFRSGDLTGSENHAKHGLKQLGEWLPTGKTAVLLSTVKELLCHVCFQFLPVFGKKRHMERYKMIIWFYDWLNWVYFFSEGYKMPRVVLRMVNLAERKIGPSRELIMAYYYYGFACTSAGLTQRAAKTNNAAWQLAQELNDSFGKTKILNGFGFYYSSTSTFHKAIQHLEELISMLERTGDSIEIISSCNILLGAYMFTSDYKNAALIFNKYFKHITNPLEEIIFSGTIYPALFFIETGNYGEGERYLVDMIQKSERAHVIFVYYASLSFLGYLYSEDDRMGQAMATFDKIYALEKKESLPPHFRAFHHHYPSALIKDFTIKKASLEPAPRRRYLRRIRKFCGLSLKHTKKWRTYYGTALRTYAQYHELIEKHQKADELFNQSIAWSKKINRPYELARTLYEYGLFLKSRNREPEAWQKLTESYQIFDEIDAPPYKHKIARLLGLDAETDRDVAIDKLVMREKQSRLASYFSELSNLHEMDSLVSTLLSQTMELTGARNAYLFLSEDADSPLKHVKSRHVDADQEDEYSLNIITRVYESSEPALTTNAEMEKEFSDYQSVALYGLKSVLCVPVKHNELINGVLYLDNDLAGGVFSRDLLKLLGELLSHGAVLIENEILRLRLRNSDSASRQAVKKAKKNPHLTAVLDFCGSHYAENISREDIATRLSMNPDYLGKLFKTQMGRTIRDYINELRVEKAAVLLIADPEKKVIDVAHEVGFESLRTFNRAFYRTTGKTPSQFRISANGL